MAHILPGPDLYAWCEHGTPLGHACQFCRIPPTMPAEPPRPKRNRDAPAGWTCPSCGHSYAPWVPECHHCPVPEQSAFIAKGRDPGPIEVGR